MAAEESFTQEAWKANIAERLQDWRSRMQQQGAPSVYAFLSAATLWPVVEAARGGEWTALTVLGGVLAGVGNNVLANRIQQWRDEADAARQIAADAAAEPALQAELDTVLTAIETVPLAQQALPESARGWFVEILLDELAHRGNLSRFATQLIGSGAIAQGAGAVAAGAGGVAVGGNVQGNVYVGAPTRDPDEALAIYRRVLVDGCRHLSLRGLDVDASDPTGSQRRLDLAQVYVDLHTTSRVPLERAETRRGKPQEELLEKRETRPLSALEAVVKHPHVVLLGDPGSGKSTFLTHLTLCLAAHSLDRRTEWLTRLPYWPQQEADIIPMTIVLRDFAHWLPEGQKKAAPRHLWNFFVARLEAQNLDFAAEPLHDRLEKGRAILLLDGLDEVPRQRERSFIRDAVAAFARRYAKTRIVVTCRTLSYQNPAWRLGDFESVTLAPCSEEQIDRFIAGWHGELARLGTIKPGAVEGVTRHLRAAVRRPDLWRLASNPLLLTVMALVHTHKGRLPEARALLYEETVDILLWRWEQVEASGEDEAPPLRQLLLQADRADVDLKRALWRLAFEAHREGGTTDTEAVADIGELRLQKALVELHPDRSHDWAQQVVEVMKLRAGLLLERAPEVYTFPHRTFQEYLAGAHLSTEPDFAQRASRLMADGSFWREVVLLAVGRLVYLHGETAKPLELVAELCPAQSQDTDVTWRQAWLAGDVLLEMGLNRVQDSALGREVLLDRVRERLVALLRGGHLSPLERAAAGNTLAHLGDPRFRADAWFLPNDDSLGFVKIPAGPFWMGSTKRDAWASEDEMPRRRITLPDYYVSRYPVTVAQFRAFVEASGHQPGDEGCLDGLPNHPVVWVSWAEALKYCDWVTGRLREWSGTPEPLATLLRTKGWIVTLPSEAEWEKAARGPDGRIYPWGGEPDPNRGNYDETGINATSAIGCFPSGASPYGVQELSGNVWEWTRSLWGEYPYPSTANERARREDLQAPDDQSRVLRGGAFNDSLRIVRCAYRYWYPPFSSYRYLGCRVVVLPCR
ncbi:MAG: SUMF1/EgtB/PvdO family nonheme iron enzyme [Candidatus Entotheonellia bacterium]